MVDFVSKIEDFCIKDEECCIKNEESCIQNDEFERATATARRRRSV